MTRSSTRLQQADRMLLDAALRLGASGDGTGETALRSAALVYAAELCAAAGHDQAVIALTVLMIRPERI